MDLKWVQEDAAAWDALRREEAERQLKQSRQHHGQRNSQQARHDTFQIQQDRLPTQTNAISLHDKNYYRDDYLNENQYYYVQHQQQEQQQFAVMDNQHHHASHENENSLHQYRSHLPSTYLERQQRQIEQYNYFHSQKME